MKSFISILKEASNEPKPMTRRDVDKLMKTANIQGEVTGSGSSWEVELPDEKAKKAFEKAAGRKFGGYKTGYGGWVLRAAGNIDMGDWNDKSSRWHY